MSLQRREVNKTGVNWRKKTTEGEINHSAVTLIQQVKTARVKKVPDLPFVDQRGDDDYLSL